MILLRKSRWGRAAVTSPAARAHTVALGVNHTLKVTFMMGTRVVAGGNLVMIKCARRGEEKGGLENSTREREVVDCSPLCKRGLVGKKVGR